jgi:hypothetical protein
MRMMLMVEIDTSTSNRIIEEHKMDQVMGGILGQLKPEAAYFYSRNGRRAFTLVVDMPDSSHLPSFAEPFWLQLNAHVEAFPCMNLDELQLGLSRLG